MAILDQTRAISDLIVAWRRDIHQHPELGFEEFRTAQVVADNLRALGLEVATGVGKTGVVGILGEGKPVIGIRADMDALPVQEVNDVPYASQTPGIMHACGHDAHTAMLLGAARILTQMPDRPQGEIRFFFQPCEEKDDDEGKSGATRMMDDGALEGLDRVIALHVASELPAGKVVIEEGFTSANVDTFFATIKGMGCHGAYPHRGVDPIFILAQVINAINGIRARRINPIRPAVVSIGSVHAGVAANVVPDDVQMNGTFRSFDDETREQLYRDLEAAFSVARVLGGDYELKITRGCPSIYNDPEVATLIRTTAQEMLGEDVILRQEPAMGGEDFSYMTRKAPGAMFLLGAKRDTLERPHHSPQFDIDESVFPIGSALLVETTLRLLKSAKV